MDYKIDRVCPYCSTTFSINGVRISDLPISVERDEQGLERKAEPQKYSIGSYKLYSNLCPTCKKRMVWLDEEWSIRDPLSGYVESAAKVSLLWPTRKLCPVPERTPALLASDFREAYLTLDISPKASAALSRRCLQSLIESQEGIKEVNLYKQIKKLFDLNKLPEYLRLDIDAIRQVGNFAAHPQKDEHSGEIVEVEPGEAEWSLKLIESLLRYYFVEIPESRARRDALNQKLADAGQNPLL